MRRRLPPLKTLPAFELAAERASFSAAAGELNLTHGAVSRQIKALETHLGVPLFRRRNRSIALTEAGTKRRAALHVVQGKEALARFDAGGLEVLSANLPTFSARLRSERHTLKRSIADPRLFSGIGNAY